MTTDRRQEGFVSPIPPNITDGPAANRFIAFRRGVCAGDFIAYAAGLLGFIVLWQCAHSAAPVGPTRIPSPVATLEAFANLIVSGTLFTETLVSVTRVMVGFTIAMAIGIPLGLLSGTFWIPHRIFSPTFSFLRYIPPTAFLSLLVIYLGITEYYKYGVVFLGVIFFLFQMSVDVARSVPKSYLEMAFSEGMSPLSTFFHVVAPFSAPRLVSVVRINLSGAWIFIVAAEIVGAQEGLGYFISRSQRFFRIEDVFVGILSFGIIGLLSDILIAKCGGLAFKWYWSTVTRN